MARATSIQTNRVSADHGFDDYDVVGLPKVHRATVGHTIKKGDIFNVYCADGVKLGATWTGNLEQSLARFAQTHPGYQYLVAPSGCKATQPDDRCCS